MLAFETHGRGEPLVLVHGLATTHVIWRRVLPYLPGEVTAIDVPGFGRVAAGRPGLRPRGRRRRDRGCP
jgi:pimeloyl-ACP methyl ester carboxylesterase